MCGRYASFRDAQDLADEFAVADLAEDARLLPPAWNVAPTDPVRIVVERAAKETGEIRRSLRVARWGLVPSWSKDARGGARMINARAETLLDKPAFAKPLAVRRCLVPADGYYEWRRPATDAEDAAARAGTGARTAKQPYFIHPDGPSAAFAGLYEFWRDRSAADDDPARWLVTTTIITTDAAPDLAPIHDRMPVTLAPGDWDTWLDPAVGPQDAAALLGGPPGVALTAEPVSTAVNTVANDGPELVRPV
ncbi:SOS response-associated peptidase [Oerskovia flava]|uniref:SOS response-associated peptidase n=1 Tax=Oerskovia flava TaxID=2986422 RepID=UPI0022407EBF|nr:SOS response-associated peptidase [Oerskovia sp. JB1-3-2]